MGDGTLSQGLSPRCSLWQRANLRKRCCTTKAKVLSLSVQWAPLMVIKLDQAMAWVTAHNTQTLADINSHQLPSQTCTRTQKPPYLILNSHLSAATALPSLAQTLCSEFPAHL